MKKSDSRGSIRGYTLIEIMIVILVIAILLLIVVPRVMEMGGRPGGRAGHNTPLDGDAGVCISNLLQIENSKRHWAGDTKLPSGCKVAPLVGDLVGSGKYLTSWPVCPAGGFYTIGDLATSPKCSMQGHAIPAQSHR